MHRNHSKTARSCLGEGNGDRNDLTGHSQQSSRSQLRMNINIITGSCGEEGTSSLLGERGVMGALTR